MPMSYERTPEHRELRRKLVHRWKPWEKSTGPRSAEGKARSSQNGYKGAVRPTMRALAKTLREQKEVLDELER
jgi:hypothetical protein